MTEKEQALAEALRYLGSLHQFQLVKEHFDNRVRQTHAALLSADNTQILEARGRYKEAKLLFEYVTKS
jgi:hypothetical protein